MPKIPASEAKAPSPKVRRRLEYAPTWLIDPSTTTTPPINLPVGGKADGAANGQNYNAHAKDSNLAPNPPQYQPPTKGGSLKQMQKG